MKRRFFVVLGVVFVLCLIEFQVLYLSSKHTETEENMQDVLGEYVDKVRNIDVDVATDSIARSRTSYLDKRIDEVEDKFKELEEAVDMHLGRKGYIPARH